MTARPDDPEAGQDARTQPAALDGATDAPAVTEDTLPPLREVIRQHGLSARKSLSQNFILDLNLTRRIARVAGPLSGNTVVEIGPGPGGLTRGLLMEGAARVIAIERDQRCQSALREIAEAYPGRLELHLADALDADWASLLGNVQGDVVIVANLPYAIATSLLVGWIESEPWPPWYARMALMFQKEVADRIVAVPGTKAYGRLAVLAQWRTQPEIVLRLRPEAFTPPPKVASAVVLFTPRPAPDPDVSVKTLARITAAAFGQRRKMLRQSLKALTPMPELLLAKCNIEPTLRAEDLSVRQFAELAAAYDGAGR
ncbi:MAG: 16S rRNA (adenine(1518)-N(6)/adenine(1519)-N(6))-dimethyltransferase RsmA [Alphaproteobacteria bacterium]|nr:16S rRNA (adenine(1518)-N(6)/adenine(1519)-N(6))-dimethyltransferase RsmA [Alphaproteobacteria bacterium]